PAGRARAGQVGQPGGAAGEVPFQDRGEGTQGGVEQEDVLAGRALLRAVHVRGAVQAGQRVVHVGGGDQGHTAGVRYAGQSRAVAQRRAAGVEPGPGRRHGDGTQGGEHAGARVVGGRAAEADHDGACAGAGRGGEQQAQGVRGGSGWVSVLGRGAV